MTSGGNSASEPGPPPILVPVGQPAGRVRKAGTAIKGSNSLSLRTTYGAKASRCWATWASWPAKLLAYERPEHIGIVVGPRGNSAAEGWVPPLPRRQCAQIGLVPR